MARVVGHSEQHGKAPHYERSDRLDSAAGYLYEAWVMPWIEDD